MKPTKRPSITLLCLLTMVAVLSACATPEEKAAAQTKRMEKMTQIHGPACEKLGFGKDTDPWRRCILDLESQAQIQQHPGYFYPYGPYLGWGVYGQIPPRRH